MDKKRVELIKQQFDLVVHNHEEAQVEYWLARDLMPLLGYERWENFDKSITRVMESCETSGIKIADPLYRCKEPCDRNNQLYCIRKGSAG